MFPRFFLKKPYKKILQFQHQINYNFKTWKNQISVTLVMVCVIMTAPNSTCGHYTPNDGNIVKCPILKCHFSI